MKNKSYLFKKTNKVLKKILVGLTVLSVLVSSGCHQANADKTSTTNEPGYPPESSGSYESSLQDPNYIIYSGNDNLRNELSETIVKENRHPLVFAPGNNYGISKEDLAAIERDYFYNMLDNDTDKADFLQMYASMLANPDAEIRFNHIASDKAIQAYDSSAFFHQFGEYMFMNGGYYDTINNYRVTSARKVDGVNMNAYRADFNNAVAGASSYPDFYSRILYLHDYIVSHFQYDFDNMYDLQNHVAGGVSDGLSVCEGFAKFSDAVFSKVGIRSVVVCSYNHAWNLVYSEKSGIWYVFDVTWDLGSTSHAWMLIGTDSMVAQDMYESHTKEYGYNLMGGNPSVSKYNFNPDADNYLMSDYAYVITDDEVIEEATEEVPEPDKNHEEQKKKDEQKKDKKQKEEDSSQQYSYSIYVNSYFSKSAISSQNDLYRIGLKCNLIYETSNTIPKDRVIRQDYENVSVDEGTTVTLWISTGPEQIQIPDFLGKSSCEAEALLKNLGLVPNATSAYNNSYSNGFVCKQQTGTVQYGSAVTYTVSLGPEPCEKAPTVIDLTVQHGSYIEYQPIVNDQFRVTAVYSNGETKDVTNQIELLTADCVMLPYGGDDQFWMQLRYDGFTKDFYIQAKRPVLTIGYDYNTKKFTFYASPHNYEYIQPTSSNLSVCSIWPDGTVYCTGVGSATVRAYYTPGETGVTVYSSNEYTVDVVKDANGNFTYTVR